jgi:hypothetical protein
MSNTSAKVILKVSRIGMCLLGTAALILPPTTVADAKPVVVRGIPNASVSNQLQVVYQTSLANGSLNPSIDKLSLGAIQEGDTGIPDSNPTFASVPGALLVGVTRPVDLPPDVIPAVGLWTTGVNFGPGSISRVRATYIAPVGPLPGGGFAIGLNAKTGNKDDLATDTRIAVTVNVRPGFLVRFGVAFGSVDPARVVLPDDVKNAMFSTTDPQPFTIDLTIDRVHGTATAKLTVIDQVFTVPFVLSDFLADGGPAITAVGPGIAVNSNAPGQTASVRVRDFRIYASQ